MLATWAGGVAAAAALVARWEIVGPGFIRLSGAVVLGFGIPAALAGSTPFPWVGVVLCAAAVLSARWRTPLVVFMVVAAGCFVVAASLDGAFVPAASGALLLGGVTGEMMLGHWYLVDPRLPREALRRLAAIGALGAVADFGVLAGFGAIPWAGFDPMFGVGFVLLGATTLVLMAAVWFALAEPGYSGVMAATGLSYLAVLTGFGSVVLGRILAG